MRPGSAGLGSSDARVARQVQLSIALLAQLGVVGDLHPQALHICPTIGAVCSATVGLIDMIAARAIACQKQTSDQFLIRLTLPSKKIHLNMSDICHKVNFEVSRETGRICVNQTKAIEKRYRNETAERC